VRVAKQDGYIWCHVNEKASGAGARTASPRKIFFFLSRVDVKSRESSGCPGSPPGKDELRTWGAAPPQNYPASWAIRTLFVRQERRQHGSRRADSKNSQKRPGKTMIILANGALRSHQHHRGRRVSLSVKASFKIDVDEHRDGARTSNSGSAAACTMAMHFEPKTPPSTNSTPEAVRLSAVLLADVTRRLVAYRTPPSSNVQDGPRHVRVAPSDAHLDRCR